MAFETFYRKNKLTKRLYTQFSLIRIHDDTAPWQILESINFVHSDIQLRRMAENCRRDEPRAR